MAKKKTFDEIIDDQVKRLEDLRKRRREMRRDEAARRQPEFENELAEILNETGKEVSREDLELLDTDMKSMVIDGKRCRRKGPSTKEYFTRFGKVPVQRTLYTERGGHGGKTIALLDLSVGMVGGTWTPSAAELASGFLEAMAPRKAAALMAQYGGLVPSASHLDRLPKLFNELWESQRDELETEVRCSDVWPEPEYVVTIGFSLDGIMLGMKGAPREEGTEGPKGHRESYTAAVFLMDEDGNRLKTIRQARAPESKKLSLTSWLEGEVKEAVRRYPGSPVHAIADGAAENWRIVNQIGLAAHVKVFPTLDFYHLSEHLGEALRACYGARSKKVGATLKEWNSQLKASSHGPRKVVAQLQKLLDKAPSMAARERMEKELAYVKRHQKKKMLRYAWLQARNLPIGSGIIEATCKTVVAERLKLSGMTWTHKGAQGILTLRALSQSGRLNMAWLHTCDRVIRKPFWPDTDTSRKRPTIIPC